MGVKLFPDQIKFHDEIISAWDNGARNVLAVAPTGSGKTVVASKVVHEHRGNSCAIAHRQELVSQLSLAYAREGIYHNILGPLNVIKLCVNLHSERIGKSYFNPDAKCTIAGVDTLLRRIERLQRWGAEQSLWIQDEAHHVQKNNKWGKVLDLFPNAKGLGFTATPYRSDGRGLGISNDGAFDIIVESENLRWMINNGRLTDYIIFAPPNNLDLSRVDIGSTGDFITEQTTAALRKSTVYGDVVKHYLRIAPGKLGVTFVPNVKDAGEISEKFNASGIPSVVIHAKTPDSDRYHMLRKYERREILQLVNVDIFGEGFDLPAIEVCSFARPTASWPLYVQQFGRALRVLKGKDRAIIIDHVGNVMRHSGPPDRPIEHTLERREKTRGESVPQLYKVCANPTCNKVYGRFLKTCPYCGYYPEPKERSGPEYVDGDLTELSPAALAYLRGEVRKVDMSEKDCMNDLFERNLPPLGIQRNLRIHLERQAAQGPLRNMIALWGGAQRAINRNDSESYRLFYLLFGIDVLTAQTLQPDAANALMDKIRKQLTLDGVRV